MVLNIALQVSNMINNSIEHTDNSKFLNKTKIFITLSTRKLINSSVLNLENIWGI